MAKVNPSKPSANVPARVEETRAAVPSVQDSRPDFLAVQGDKPAGLETVAQYIRPSRLKIVQKTAGEPFSKLFNTGDIVVMPETQLLVPVQLNAANKPGDYGDPFHFTPIYFYAEWAKWNPFGLSNAPAIIERTLDPRHDIARRAQSPQTWFEDHPQYPNDPKMRIRYVEHLNIVCVVYGFDEYQNVPLVISCARGEHRSGTAFCGLLSKRRADIFGTVFEARSAYRPSKGQGDWYGIDFMNPSTESGISPWVQDKSMLDAYRELYLQFKEAHESKIIDVQYDDPDVVNASASSSEAAEY